MLSAAAMLDHELEPGFRSPSAERMRSGALTVPPSEFAGDAAFYSGDTVRFDIADQPTVAPLEIAREFFKDRSPLEVSFALRERRIDHFLRAFPKSFVLLRRDDVVLR